MLSESVFFTTERRGVKRDSSACLEATAAIQKAETSALIKNPLSALLTLVKAPLPAAAIWPSLWIPQKAKLHLTARITPAILQAAALGLVTPADLREMQLMLDMLQRPRASQAVRL